MALSHPQRLIVILAALIVVAEVLAIPGTWKVSIGIILGLSIIGVSVWSRHNMVTSSMPEELEKELESESYRMTENAPASQSSPLSDFSADIPASEDESPKPSRPRGRRITVKNIDSSPSSEVSV